MEKLKKVVFKIKFRRSWSILVLFIILLNACSSDEVERIYIKEINTQRSKKDAFFKYSDDSPLSLEMRKEFTGLNYFDIDMDYKLSARIELVENPEMVYLTNSLGENLRVYPYARLWFEINGRELSLLAFRHFDLWMYFRESGFVFIPFTDKSNEDLTYPLGRYLGIELSNENSEVVILDFNKSYNPFCAYNENAVCPYPPAENFLDVKILAGEKRW